MNDHLGSLVTFQDFKIGIQLRNPEKKQNILGEKCELFAYLISKKKWGKGKLKPEIVLGNCCLLLYLLLQCEGIDFNVAFQETEFGLMMLLKSKVSMEFF